MCGLRTSLVWAITQGVVAILTDILGQTVRRIFMGEESKKKAGSNQSNQPINRPTNQRAELEFLKTTFRENGDSLKQIRRALNPASRTLE